MTIFASRIIIILVLLNSDTFADKDSVPVSETFVKTMPFVGIIKDTNEAGMVRIIRDIDKDGGNIESITTIYNKKGKLIYSKHKIYRKLRLVLIAEDGIVRKIVHGATGCDFVVIEPSGDSIFFKLDPKKEPKQPFYLSAKGDSIIFFEHLKVPKASPKNKYEEIIYHMWGSHCQAKVGF